MDEKPKPKTRRELIGRIAEAEALSVCPSRVAAADKSGIARSNLYRLFDGNPQVTARLFRRFERAFGLPQMLFTFILANDRKNLEALDMDPNVKRLILDTLVELGPGGEPPRQSTKGARRGA